MVFVMSALEIHSLTVNVQHLMLVNVFATGIIVMNVLITILMNVVFAMEMELMQMEMVYAII